MSKEAENTWIQVLKQFINEDKKMIKLRTDLKRERKNATVLPEGPKTFEVFRILPLEKTRVVIVGQDPYHERKHSTGIAFSSTCTSERPGLLANIFREIHSSLYTSQKYENCFKTSDLTSWVDQGVLLMNTSLSTIQGKPGSHKDLGWEAFVAKVLEIADKLESNPIFVFMGSRAEEMKKYISTYPDTLSFVTGHPSSKTADKYFHGNGIFKAINDELMRRFFKDLFHSINENINFEGIASTTRSFMDSKGFQGISMDTLGKNAELYAEGFPRFMTDQFTKVRNEIEINWRT